jgi:hypothetical protein
MTFFRVEQLRLSRVFGDGLKAGQADGTELAGLVFHVDEWADGHFSSVGHET